MRVAFSSQLHWPVCSFDTLQPSRKFAWGEIGRSALLTKEWDYNTCCIPRCQSIRLNFYCTHFCDFTFHLLRIFYPTCEYFFFSSEWEVRCEVQFSFSTTNLLNQKTIAKKSSSKILVKFMNIPFEFFQK